MASTKTSPKPAPKPAAGKRVAGPRRNAVALKLKAAAPAVRAAKAAAVRATADPLPRNTPFLRAARPDALDYRDRPFRPNIGKAPPPFVYPDTGLPVKHQGSTNACTGFALAVVVEHLLRAAQREPKPAISPFMLYSMARRYDEFPGSTEDEGSSTRGALKGWFKHGACREGLFPDLAMPPPGAVADGDWWADAVSRPLGAYYRIDPQAITDMHAALHEVGALLVSSGCHEGWDDGIEQKTLRRRPKSIDEVWEIPVREGKATHSAHAFAIVGYDRRGFLVHNSWGSDWGSFGYAILTYDDWLRNAMDCWVAQLGVVTQEHKALSKAVTLRTTAGGRVALAADPVLRDRELSPFIVNMGSDGSLSNSGVFRTQPSDVEAIVDVHLAAARALWKPADRTIDVCVFAHGGLVGEAGAAEVAAQWIPMLYDRQVFPVFLMWETDFFSAALGCIENAVKGLPRTAAGGVLAGSWWNERLERLLARPGTQLWREMKENADAMSLPKPGAPLVQQPGCVQLYQRFRERVERGQVRMHVVAHSAGAVVAAHMVDRMARDGMAIASVSWLAPALTQADYDAQVRPHLESGAIGRSQHFHLTESAESEDGSCGAYRRSLLYLVSQSFEGGVKTPVVGMKRHYDRMKTPPRTTAWVAPGEVSAATTHGRFDNDPGTRAQVLKFILQRG